MARFRGTDPTISVLNYVKNFKSTLKYHLLHANVHTTFDELVESAAFELRIDTEYEVHYRRSRAVPVTDRSDVDLDSCPETQTSIPPDPPSEGEYVAQSQEYPRKATARSVDCNHCSTGTPTCPNCSGESVVTCPDCYTPRSGDCNNCGGSGKVTCSECRGGQKCVQCSGSGKVRCGGCGGTGTVEKTKRITKKCPDCLGHDDHCSTCNGRGSVKEWVTETVRHDSCNGTGKQTCGNCLGSGRCPTCNGTGKVTCNKCGGTGRCGTCGGDGTKTCPTCHGEATVTCPVCEGDAELFVYTADNYEFEPVEDEADIVPSLFEEYYASLEPDEDMELEIAELTESDVKSELGLLNSRIKDTLTRAGKRFDTLLEKTKQRQFDHAVKTKDETRQDRLRRKLKDTIKRQWADEPSDSYDAEFTMTLHDRSERHDDIHKHVLYQDFHYWLLPLSMIEVTVGDDQQRLFYSGIDDEPQVSRPSFPYSPWKVLLFLGLVVSCGAAVYGLANDLWVFVGSFAAPVAHVAGGLAFLDTLGYGYLVYRSLTHETEDLLVLVGDRDATTMAFLSVLSHTVSLKDMGVVRDDIYKMLSENLFEDISLGASISIAIDMRNSGVVRLVGLNSSYAERGDEITDLIENSTGIVGIVSDADDSHAEEVLNFIENHDVPAALVRGDGTLDTDDVDYPVYDVPMEQLRKEYLESDGETDETIVEPIKEVR